MGKVSDSSQNIGALQTKTAISLAWNPSQKHVNSAQKTSMWQQDSPGWTFQAKYQKGPGQSSKISTTFFTDLNCLSQERNQCRKVVPVLGAPTMNSGFLMGICNGIVQECLNTSTRLCILHKWHNCLLPCFSSVWFELLFFLLSSSSSLWTFRDVQSTHGMVNLRFWSLFWKHPLWRSSAVLDWVRSEQGKMGEGGVSDWEAGVMLTSKTSGCSFKACRRASLCLRARRR